MIRRLGEQAQEDRRLVRERLERANAAAAEELELGALVANADVAEEVCVI